MLAKLINSPSALVSGNYTNPVWEDLDVAEEDDDEPYLELVAAFCSGKFRHSQSSIETFYLIPET
jgi:hypothetical protein